MPERFAKGKEPARLWIDGQQFIEVLAIPSGEFLMGSRRGLPLERPVHSVAIRKSFCIGRFPITQAQWHAAMGSNPSAFSGIGELPVENISWENAKAFCERLTEVNGRTVRLPSEAEWEYACRAGTRSEFFFGDDERALDEYGWFELNSGERKDTVGQKKRNKWGIFDLAGNIWEWCEDVWQDDYSEAANDARPQLQLAKTQPRRC